MTVIRFSIGQGAESIALKIYDVSGRLVRQWDYSTIRQSDHIVWDGTDQNDRKVPAGVYFVRFEAGDYKKTEKAILLR
jgi:flagellar hook assembly protein FlgD